MSHDKLRRQIAHEAARLLHLGQLGSLARARLTAARRLVRGWVRDEDLPSDEEIRVQLAHWSQRARLDRPSVDPLATWTIETAGSTTSESAASESTALGSPAPGDPLPADDSAGQERFLVFERLLWPLEHVQQSPKHHPEGDALYHSLQVFELARGELPYDEEFLLAALLHDVGKAVDPHDHVAAGLELLAGWITDRTAWFIEHQGLVRALGEGTLGMRAVRRLTESDDFEELKLLAACDRRGRMCGAIVPELPEALDYVRQLAELCGE